MTQGSDAGARITNGVSLEHGNHGDESYAFLMVNRGLKSGKLDEVRLSEGDLLGLIETSAKALRVLQFRKPASS